MKETAEGGGYRRRMDGRVGRDASPWMQTGTFGQGIRGEGKQMVCKPFIRQKKITNTKKGINQPRPKKRKKESHYSPAAAFLGVFMAGRSRRAFVL